MNLKSYALATPKLVKSLWHNRSVLSVLIKRDILKRFKGTILGSLWYLIGPLFLLAIFTFVFSKILSSRWPDLVGDIPIWVHLFCGITAYSMFSEIFSRAPDSILSQPNFVKKIIFPVEILPLVSIGTAMIQLLINLTLLILALLWFNQLSIKLLLLPLLMSPLLIAALGLALIVSSWGVFIRDIKQIVVFLTQILLFLSPVFYPISLVPERLQPFYQLNPIGSVIESLRATISGNTVNWEDWLISLMIAVFLCIFGAIVFEVNRDEFADAL